MELEDFRDLGLSSILNDKGEWQPVESHSWLRRLYITSGLTCFQELQKEKNWAGSERAFVTELFHYSVIARVMK